MALLGVDIPPLDGHVQLRFLMTKKRTLEMCVCVKEFVDSVVLEAVQQRTDKVKFVRRAKVEEIRVKVKKEAVAVAAAAAAIEKRKEMPPRRNRSSHTLYYAPSCSEPSTP